MEQDRQDNASHPSASLSPSIFVSGHGVQRRWRMVTLAIAGLVLMIFGIFMTFLYLSPEKAARMALESGRKSAGLVRKELVLPGGLLWVYLEGGSGEPVLLLHGFGANKDTFVSTAQFLTDHYRVIIPDLTGFGESAHPTEADYSPPAQVERLRQFAKALGIARVHLGGNSMGGQISLTYAALYPNEVASLWLLNPAGVWSAPQSEFKKILAETGQNMLLIKTPDEFKRLLAFGMARPPPIPEPILRVFAQERILNFALEERIFPQILAYSVEEQVARMAIPSLIVWGDGDRILHPASSEILRKLLVRSKVVTMPGIGHLPMLEAAQECAEDYLRFRKSLPGPAEIPTKFGGKP